MARKVGWVVALGFVLVHCGGIAVSPADSDDAASAGSGSTAAANGGTGGTSAVANRGTAGTSAEDGGCLADLSEAGCGGEAGEGALSPYARLRTSCQSQLVNRRGTPVPITFCIH